MNYTDIRVNVKNDSIWESFLLYQKPKILGDRLRTDITKPTIIFTDTIPMGLVRPVSRLGAGQKLLLAILEK